MAVSYEYGKCNGCGKEQSKSLDNCRHCGVALPWNKGAAKANKAASSSDRIGIGDIAWAAMGVQIFGGILFVAGICMRIGLLPSFPFLGYIVMASGAAIWGFGSQMD